jgi:hypothetical protein
VRAGHAGGEDDPDVQRPAVAGRDRVQFRRRRLLHRQPGAVERNLFAEATQARRVHGAPGRQQVVRPAGSESGDGGEAGRTEVGQPVPRRGRPHPAVHPAGDPVPLLEDGAAASPATRRASSGLSSISFSSATRPTAR